MFGTLNPNNDEDSKILLDFYKKSYNQLDLSQVNQVHAQTNNRLTVQKPMSPNNWDDTQLRMINKDVLRQFGQGNLTDLQRKYQEKLEMEQLQLSYRMTMQHPLGQTINREQQQYAAKLYGSAVRVQKYMRGQIARNRVKTNLQAYYFFKKVQRISLIRQLVFGLKDAYISVKETKQRYLKRYIFFCATKIQTLYRAHHARKVIVPIRRKLGPHRGVLRAVAEGWKIRRIMKTKEIQVRIHQIRDCEAAEESAQAERQVGDAG